MNISIRYRDGQSTELTRADGNNLERFLPVLILQGAPIIKAKTAAGPEMVRFTICRKAANGSAHQTKGEDGRSKRADAHRSVAATWLRFGVGWVAQSRPVLWQRQCQFCSASRPTPAIVKKLGQFGGGWCVRQSRHSRTARPPASNPSRFPILSWRCRARRTVPKV